MAIISQNDPKSTSMSPYNPNMISIKNIEFFEAKKSILKSTHMASKTSDLFILTIFKALAASRGEFWSILDIIWIFEILNVSEFL